MATYTPEDLALILNLSILSHDVAGYTCDRSFDHTHNVGVAIGLVSGLEIDAVVPPDVLRRAVVEVAAELYHRAKAPGGYLTASDGYDGTPMRLVRDPLSPAKVLLAAYLPVGIA